MKREDIDWPVLSGAIAILMVSMIVSSLLIVGSFYFQKKMVREFTLNNALFQDISRKYLAVDEEDKLIKKFYPQFIDLYNHGVIGKEQRLNWIETLRDTGEKVRVPALNYEIRSQSVFIPGFPVSLGRYQLYDSEMILNMQLLHEGDLLDILDDLNKEASGIFSVAECRLARVSQVIDVHTMKANISSKCNLHWYTIRLADGSDIKV